MAFALITGASKGIGKALACELAKRGHDVLLVARSAALLKINVEEIQATWKVKAAFLDIDLSQPDAAIKVKYWCVENKYDVDILINNAGYGLWGFFEELKLDDQLNMMQLNMQTLVSMTHHFIPLLKKNSKAWLMNTSSTSAYQAVPTMSAYSASKIFVLTFTRGLQFELKGSVISVSCLVPGTTDTGFMDRANMSDDLKKYAEKFNMTAAAVAKTAIDGLFKGQVEIVPGATNIVNAVGTKFLPKRLVEKIAANIYLKRLK
jgi:short-subunit dehydrogenase